MCWECRVASSPGSSTGGRSTLFLSPSSCGAMFFESISCLGPWCGISAIALLPSTSRPSSAGASGGWPGFLFRRRSRKTAVATRASPHTPPTTPPAIAPVLLLRGLLATLGDGVEDGDVDGVADGVAERDDDNISLGGVHASML